MALAVGHRRDVDTLQQAFRTGDGALMGCQLAASGETVTGLCAANRQQDGSLAFAPVAMLFNGNPDEILNPPNLEGGFSTQGEIREE